MVLAIEFKLSPDLQIAGIHIRYCMGVLKFQDEVPVYLYNLASGERVKKLDEVEMARS